jgi:hypothetical protein
MEYYIYPYKNRLILTTTNSVFITKSEKKAIEIISEDTLMKPYDRIVISVVKLDDTFLVLTPFLTKKNEIIYICIEVSREDLLRILEKLKTNPTLKAFSDFLRTINASLNYILADREILAETVTLNDL